MSEHNNRPPDAQPEPSTPDETLAARLEKLADYDDPARVTYAGKVQHDAAKRLRELAAAISEACAIIEMGDQRLLASDGPAGNQPPDLTLGEWRKLYVTLDDARQQLAQGGDNA